MKKVISLFITFSIYVNAADLQLKNGTYQCKTLEGSEKTTKVFSLGDKFKIDLPDGSAILFPLKRGIFLSAVEKDEQGKKEFINYSRRIDNQTYEVVSETLGLVPSEVGLTLVKTGRSELRVNSSKHFTLDQKVAEGIYHSIECSYSAN